MKRASTPIAQEASAVPLSETWASCTSDRDGDCSFTVPQTNRKWVCSLLVFCGWENQANRDKRFWAVQESAPEGWSANDRLIVGTSSNSSSERYAFRTGTERAMDRHTAQVTSS
ncbi:hypothetical protein IOD13_05050 [Brevibacterium casei]|nr:hypothetical protein [Brevibacterium casei]